MNFSIEKFGKPFNIVCTARLSSYLESRLPPKNKYRPFTPDPQQMELAPDVSGNIINGLGVSYDWDFIKKNRRDHIIYD